MIDVLKGELQKKEYFNKLTKSDHLKRTLKEGGTYLPTYLPNYLPTYGTMTIDARSNKQSALLAIQIGICAHKFYS